MVSFLVRSTLSILIAKSHPRHPRDQSGAMQSGPSRWGNTANGKSNGLTAFISPPQGSIGRDAIGPLLLCQTRSRLYVPHRRDQSGVVNEAPTGGEGRDQAGRALPLRKRPIFESKVDRGVVPPFYGS